MINLINLRTSKRTDYLYIGRYNSFRGLKESKWQNPFIMQGEKERTSVLKKYLDYILIDDNLWNSLSELDNKNLACWCSPKRCHGHILIELRELQKQHGDCRTQLKELIDPTTFPCLAFLVLGA